MVETQVTKGNIGIEELKAIDKKIGRQKRGPTPPAPQNALRRFQFFTGPNGKGYPRPKIQYEMQRFAFTREGGKMFRKIQEQQRQQQVSASPDVFKAHEQTKPKGVMHHIKKAFGSMKSQRGS